MSSSSPSPVIVQFQPGELIFATGDPGTEAYILEIGQVEIFIDTQEQPVTIRCLGPGDVLGEMAVIDAAPRSASARALVTTRCIVISSQQISERIDEADPVVRLVINTLLNRMRTLTSRTDNTSERHAPDDDASLTESTPSLSGADQGDQPHGQSHYQSQSTYGDIIDKMRLESELRTAIASDSLIPHYQPLVDLQTDQIVGFELLVRWQSPSRGRVSPGLFISIAEETSLIIPVGDWALKAACQAAQSFQKEINRPLFISVNISAKQFLSPGFTQQLADIIPPQHIQHIKLEVTESLLMEGDRAIQTLQTCRKMGFHISLDDFGTGFSSLSYIAELEIDSLKIDQSFVRKMLDHKRTFTLTKSMLAMAHELGMVAIAEGIETTKHRDLLKTFDCHIGQGYLFGAPMPFEDALALLTSQKWSVSSRI
ncbi:MAG: EAL domain-containing protein [Cyanobacteria bacterium P01_A01_bin.105]